jgi:hypothetical protein
MRSRQLNGNPFGGTTLLALDDLLLHTVPSTHLMKIEHHGIPLENVD